MDMRTDRHDTTPPLSRRGALNRLGAALASVAGVAAIGGPAAAQEGTPTPPAGVPDDFKVVLHAAEEQHWPYIRSNLANLTQD